GIVGMGDAERMVRQVLGTEFGDLNLDGRVDLIDLDLLAANFGSSGKTWSSADMTGDDQVDLFDFFHLARNWGFGVSGGLEATHVTLDGQTFLVTSSTPEPTVLAGALFLSHLA